MTFCERLKLLREQNRMTLEDVATHIGVGRATVYKYENGIITNVPSDKIELLAKLFNVSPAYLMGWEELDWQPAEKTIEARIISSGVDRLSKQQRVQVLNVIRAMFPQMADLFSYKE